MISFKSRIRRMFRMPYEQTNWTTQRSSGEWERAIWRIDGDPHDARSWTIIYGEPDAQGGSA